MCGIIWARREGGAATRIALKRYHAQSQRGKRGFGYVPVEDGYVKRVMRFTGEDEFLAALKDEKASEILVHHRAPTSTENLLGATHPVVVDDPMFDYKYYVIHNGVLSNEAELKKKHEALGLVYNTEFTRHALVRFKNGDEVTPLNTGGFLDSEALAKELALYIEEHKHTIDVRGSVAFICIQTERDGRVRALYYGNNGERTMVLESVEPKKKHHESYCVIKSQGAGAPIQSDILFRLDYTTGKCTTEDVKIDERYAPVRTYGYDTQSYILPKKTEPTKTISLIDKNTPLIESEIHLSLTSLLVSRYEVIEEEVASMKADRHVYQQCLATYDDSVDINEVVVEIEDLTSEITELCKEQKLIQEELLNRDSKGMLSPYQQEIIKA